MAAPRTNTPWCLNPVIHREAQFGAEVIVPLAIQPESSIGVLDGLWLLFNRLYQLCGSFEQLPIILNVQVIGKRRF